MRVKKIHTMAKPVVSAAGMRRITQGTGNCCTRQYAAFAKNILDKYTKILNYQFDPVSLVFLEQIANGEGFAKPDASGITLTCSLLTYLIQNAGQGSLFSDHHSFLVQQLTGQVERNLEILKETAPDACRELSRYYLAYQRFIAEDMVHAGSLDGESRADTVHGQGKNQKPHPDAVQEEALDRQVLTERLRSLNARYGTSRQMQAPNRMPGLIQAETRHGHMPFVMTHVFFTNLNHWIRENRIPNFRQIWRQVNERQLIQQNLDRHMQQFLQEEDFIRQEEQLSDMLRQYGNTALLEYIDRADAKVCQKVLPVLRALSGQTQEMYRAEREQGQQGYQTAARSDSRDAGQAQDTALTREQLLEKYQNAQVQLVHILSESDEKTKNRLQETAEEYKKQFYAHIQAERRREQENGAHSLQQPALQEQENAGAGFFGVLEPQEEDTEVFSDEKIALLLQDAGGQPVSAERETAELKLKLLAFREITEQFLQEGSAALQRETLKKITRLLDQKMILQDRPLDEFQRADRELAQILLNSDEITKNMLLEKTEEYQELFYRYIRSGQMGQTTRPAEAVAEPGHGTVSAEGFRPVHSAESADRTPWLQTGAYKELFSDREITLLLQDDADALLSAEEKKAAEYKLDLLAFRETAKQLLQPGQKETVKQVDLQQETGKEADLNQETLKKILQLLEQVPFREISYITSMFPKTEEMAESSFRAQEDQNESGYGGMETQLLHILSECDEITKNMLQEKTQEYQELFYQYIRAESDAGQESAETGKPWTPAETQGADDLPVEDPMIFSDAEISLLQMTGSGMASKERQAAEQKLRLFSYREIAEQLLQEESTVLQRENLQKITQLLGGIYSGHEDSVIRKQPLLEKESGNISGKETVRNLYDAANILEHGSLPERKLFFLTAEKTVDEMLIELQETGNAVQPAGQTAAEHGMVLRQEDIGQLVQVKKQLVQIGGQAYHSADDWGFLLTKEAGRGLLQTMQQEKDQVKTVLGKRIQHALADFYGQIAKEEFPLQMPYGSSVGLQWGRVFSQEELLQLQSLVQPQKRKPLPQTEISADRTHPDGNYPDASAQPEPSMAEQGRRTHLQPEPHLAEQGKLAHLQLEQKNADSASLRQNVRQELEYFQTGSREMTEPGAFGLPQAVISHQSAELLLKDFEKKPSDSEWQLQLVRHGTDFMQPPAEDSQNRLFMQERAARGEADRPDAGQALPEAGKMVHMEQKTGEDAAQQKRLAREKEQEQKRELQRLEGDLLDYQSSLRAESAKLEQVEKKLATQEKELKQMRESRHTVKKKGTAASERKHVLKQLKEEIQLERMRSGLV